MSKIAQDTIQAVLEGGNGMYCYDEYLFRADPEYDDNSDDESVNVMNFTI